MLGDCLAIGVCHPDIGAIKADTARTVTYAVGTHGSAIAGPELKVYLTEDRAWKERYHQNMFDAVALGMMALIKG